MKEMRTVHLFEYMEVGVSTGDQSVASSSLTTAPVTLLCLCLLHSTGLTQEIVLI